MKPAYKLVLGFLLFLSIVKISISDANNKVLNICQPGDFAMTFDQGPSIYTGDVLDALDAKGCKATFHPVTTFLQQPSIVANLQRAHASGHLIGFSVEESVNISSMSDPDEILSTLSDRAQAVQRALQTSEPPYFLRLPDFAKLTDDQISIIVDKGHYVLSTYNLDSYDYSKNGSDILESFKEVLDQLSPNTKGGFISVQRDYIQDSVNQVPAIIDYVQGKGYTLVTLDHCFKDGKVPGHTQDKTATSDGVRNTPIGYLALLLFSIVALYTVQ